MTVWIVQGEHFSFPGRPLRVYSTLAKAQARALDLVNMNRQFVGLKPAADPLRWEASMETARRKRAHDLGMEHVSHLDDDPDSDGWVLITEHEVDAVDADQALEAA